MGRGKRERAGHRGGDNGDWHGARGSNTGHWENNSPEDDPFRDLRPHTEDLADPAVDDYMWPDMNDENEEDD
jgi:hypothetical protein